MCPPERPRSGVSIRKCGAAIRKCGAAIRKCCVSICERHASMCKRDVSIHERHRQTMDTPLWGARAGTQAPPLPTSIIFFHAIPHKQNNHLHITCNPPNESNRPHAQSPKRNRRGGACVPARTSAQRRFHPKMRCCHPQMRCCHPQMLCFHLRKACFHVQTRCFYPREAPTNDGYALAGRAGGHTGTTPYHAYRTASKRRNHFSNKTNGRTCADAIRADVNTLAEGF